MQPDDEGKKFRLSLALPLLFVFALWVVTVIQEVLGVSFAHLGVYPRSGRGLPGILLLPFIHADFSHLLSNTIPLIVMGTGLIYFYRQLSYKVVLIIYLASGLCLWVAAREAYHIGASALVYGLASFLFFSGVFRRNPHLASISLVVVFLYGGMFWGIFPLRQGISWEGHLFGAIAGFACALAYRHQGPQRPLYSWELEPEDDDEPTAGNEGQEGLSPVDPDPFPHADGQTKRVPDQEQGDPGHEQDGRVGR